MSHEIRELEKDLLSARTARDVAWREVELLRAERDALHAEVEEAMNWMEKRGIHPACDEMEDTLVHRASAISEQEVHARRERDEALEEVRRLRSERSQRPRGDAPAPGHACPICRGPLVEQDGHTVCRACAMWWWSVDNFCPIPGPAMDGHLAPAAIVLHSGEPGPKRLELFARVEDARRWAAEYGGEVIRISEVGWHGAGEGEGGNS